MTTLHATPYNSDAAGFYFESLEEYEAQSKSHLDCFGNLVEEYEIQLIDSDDAQLFSACGINQVNVNTWFESLRVLRRL